MSKPICEEATAEIKMSLRDFLENIENIVVESETELAEIYGTLS